MLARNKRGQGNIKKSVMTPFGEIEKPFEGIIWTHLGITEPRLGDCKSIPLVNPIWERLVVGLVNLEKKLHIGLKPDIPVLCKIHDVISREIDIQGMHLPN